MLLTLSHKILNIFSTPTIGSVPGIGSDRAGSHLARGLVQVGLGLLPLVLGRRERLVVLEHLLQGLLVLSLKLLLFQGAQGKKERRDRVVV